MFMKSYPSTIDSMQLMFPTVSPPSTGIDIPHHDILWISSVTPDRQQWRLVQQMPILLVMHDLQTTSSERVNDCMSSLQFINSSVMTVYDSKTHCWIQRPRLPNAAPNLIQVLLCTDPARVLFEARFLVEIFRDVNQMVLVGLVRCFCGCFM